MTKDIWKFYAICAFILSLISIFVCAVDHNSYNEIIVQQEEIIAKHNTFVEHAYDRMSKTENRLERDEDAIAILYYYRSRDAVQGEEIDKNASGRIVVNTGTWW